ncbi:MAG: hypothetical protein SFW09_12795 [Hyphomicrobiaceae bacterium]|nr:hypothetical protein [Hyphomicrobiaceae bacterium]
MQRRTRGAGPAPSGMASMPRPDVVVTCAPPSTSTTLDEPVLVVPVLVVEVMSPANEDDT